MDNKRLKKPYENFEVYHPEGHLMFRCAEKRINWYLDRDLAEKTGPKSIKLKFSPKGYGEDENSLHIKRENVCVCCGEKNIEKLTKHHIIPHNFRKYLPEEYKSRSSIELVSICRECHYIYEEEAMKFKKFLYDTYEINNKTEKEPLENSLLGKIKRKEKALLLIEREDIKEKILNEIEYISEKLEKITGTKYEKFVPVEIPKEDPAKILMSKFSDNSAHVDFFCSLWINHFFDKMDTDFIDPRHKEYLLKKY